MLKPGRGGVAYSDGQFDDARLNLLLASTAEQGGASLRTRCRVVGFERSANGRLSAAISETDTGVARALGRWRDRQCHRNPG